MHFLILFEAEEDATLAARAEGGPAGLVSEPVSTKRTHFFFYLCIHFWPEDHMTATGFKSKYSGTQPARDEIRAGGLSLAAHPDPTAEQHSEHAPNIWPRAADVHVA